MPPFLKTLPRDLARDRSGASAIIVALSMVAVLGFVGLGIDAGGGYLARRSAQNAADSAAFSAAAAAQAGATNLADQARAVAGTYGFRSGFAGVQVAVNTPPASGGLAGNPKAVEVIVSTPAKRLFSTPFTKSGGVVRARAVALLGHAADACVMAFNPTAAQAVLFNGAPEVNLAGCSLYANSRSGSALLLNGAADLSARSVELVGGYQKNGQVSIDTTDGIHTGKSPIADPYADVAIPSYSGCANQPPVNSGQSVTFSPNPDGSPKVFCNGLTFNGSTNITFKPGVYVIDRGTLIINGGAVVRGTGVTIVFTSSTGSGYANLIINGGADVNLSPPATGPTAGMVFFQDRRAPSGVSDIINGGSTQVLTGAIYFPRQMVLFNGGAAVSTSGCTQLLADQITFNGNANLAINCAGIGVRPAGGAAPKLVE